MSKSINSPIVLLLLRNVYSQRLRVIVENNSSIEIDRLLEIADRLELNIAEALELVGLLVLHETHILHRELLEDLNHVVLDDTLRKITDKGQEWWLCGEWLLPQVIVAIVETAKMTRMYEKCEFSKMLIK